MSMQALRLDHQVRAEKPWPISGWTLPVVLQLDEVVGGFARWAMSASNLRRQLIGLAAAELLEFGPTHVAHRLNAEGEPLQSIVVALMSWPARRLVDALLGNAPEGYVGALAKAGEQPLAEAGGYRALHELLLHGGQMRIQVMKQATFVNYGTIQRLLALDPLVCQAGFLEKLQTLRQVHAVNHIVRLAQELAGADAERIRASVEHQDNVGEWARRWISKAGRLPCSTPQLGPEFRVLKTPEEMREAARRFRNCLKTKITSVFAGARAVYAEYLEDAVIVELVPLEPGEHYLLNGIYGPANRRPLPSVARTVWKKLAAVGVLTHSARFQSAVVGDTLELAGSWDHLDAYLYDEDDDQDEKANNEER